MQHDQERLTGLLGRAALSVWGDMPRDIQETLFETAMKGKTASAKRSPGCRTLAIRERCIRRDRTEDRMKLYFGNRGWLSRLP